MKSNKINMNEVSPKLIKNFKGFLILDLGFICIFSDWNFWNWLSSFDYKTNLIGKPNQSRLQQNLIC